MSTLILPDLTTMFTFSHSHNFLVDTINIKPFQARIPLLNIDPPQAENGELVKVLVDCFNPLTAKLFNLNFHPLEVVSR